MLSASLTIKIVSPQSVSKPKPKPNPVVSDIEHGVDDVGNFFRHLF